MDTDALVKLITGEVLKRLRQAQPLPGTPASVGKTHKVLAVFTGGTIGLEQALKELGKVQSLGSQITVVLSRAAEQIVGAARIREELGGNISIVTAESPYPGAVLREADLVMAPVLTQNTAAKLAHTFADSLPATLILQALMLGKPVIAAANAADPQDDRRAGIQMTNAAPALMQALRDNLQKVSGYGIKLVDVSCLAEMAGKIFCPVVKQEKAPAVFVKKAVLDAAAVKSAAMSGVKTLTIEPGTLVTPLAMDVAGEYAVELIYAPTGM